MGSDAAYRDVSEVGTDRPELLDELAALTREAFAAGDMLPGLPAADGASDTAASIEADLRSGIKLWMVRDADGEPAGCVRAIPRAGSVWQIRRLAVSRSAQGGGLGKLLVRGLEDAARAAGIRTVVVWALVERGIPPFYSMLGYRTTGHFGSPDKPLSEAIMEAAPGADRPALSYPWGTEPADPGSGVLINWFGSARRTVAVTGSPRPRGDLNALADRDGEVAAALGGSGLRFLGSDGWPDCSTAEAAALGAELAARADRSAGGAILFDRPCVTVSAFTMPRTVADQLLALCRVPLPG